MSFSRKILTETARTPFSCILVSVLRLSVISNFSVLMSDPKMNLSSLNWTIWCDFWMTWIYLNYPQDQSNWTMEAEFWPFSK